MAAENHEIGVDGEDMRHNQTQYNTIRVEGMEEGAEASEIGLICQTVVDSLQDMVFVHRSRRNWNAIIGRSKQQHRQAVNQGIRPFLLNNANTTRRLNFEKGDEKAPSKVLSLSGAVALYCAAMFTHCCSIRTCGETNNHLPKKPGPFPPSPLAIQPKHVKPQFHT